MTRPQPLQLNIRSSFARTRAAQLAKATGMTTTQVVEEALRAFMPPSDTVISSKLIRKGPILVKPADGKPITLTQANAALDETRAGER